MKKEIAGETHFEDLVQKNEDCVKNVASQNPYTLVQTVSICFNIIDKCDFCCCDFRDWRRKSKLEKPGLPLKLTLHEPSKKQETQTRPLEIAIMRILEARCR